MTPVLAQGLVFDCDVTCALMLPSPASGCETNWNWSAELWISLPAPLMVHVPLLSDALPASPGLPTSAHVHGEEQPVSPPEGHCPAPHTTQDRLDEKVPSVCTLTTTVSPPVVDAGSL